MKSVFKKLIKLSGILSIALIIAFALSCEIGLGSAVDTEPPSITIDYPKADDVIRDAFRIGGTWSDDGTITDVKVTLKRIDTEEIINEDNPFEATFEEADTDEDENAKNTWSCVIDPKNADFPITDGSYLAYVAISDEGEHTTTQTLLFTIDNTAPVIVLQRPSSKAKDTAVDSYGQKFTLEGQAADDNNVNKITVKFYSDEACTKQVHSVDLKNVPPTISLDVATFKADVQNDYAKIYGSTSKEGTKSFYCRIEAYDDAKYYPISSADPTAYVESGNVTSTYYLYEDISSSILANHRITELYHMMNGTYNDGSDARAAEVSSVKTTLAKNVVSTGRFSLNPANNPTFTVSGRDPLKLDGKDFNTSANDVSNNGSIVVEVATGLDGIVLKGATLKVYATECDAKGAATGKRLYPATTSSKSGTSYKFVTTISKTTGFEIGKNYVLGVEGTDESGNDVVPNGKAFGFHLATSGAAPTLSVSAPESSLTYVKKGDSVVVSGYTEVEDGLPVITIKNGETVFAAKTFKAAEKTVVNNRNRYNFAITLGPDKFNQNATTQYSLSIQSTCEGLTTTVNKDIYYDVAAPEVTKFTVEPTVSNWVIETEDGDKIIKPVAINGKIKLGGSLKDNDYVQTVTYKFMQAGVVKCKGDLSQAFDGKEIDTNANGIKDNTDATIIITATDRAGNSKDFKYDYYVDQDSNKPVIKANPISAWSDSLVPNIPKTVKERTDTTNKFTAGGSLYAKISDDDELSEVKFTIVAIDAGANYEGTTETNPSYMSTYASGNGYTNTSGVVTHKISTAAQDTLENIKLPDHTGFYKVTIEATDGSGTAKNYAKKEFYILITGTAPDVMLSNNTDFIKSGNPLTLTVTMSGQPPYRLSVQEQTSTDADSDGEKDFETKETIELKSDSSADVSGTKIKNGSLTKNGNEYEYTFSYAPENNVSQIIKISVTDDADGTTTREKSYKVDDTAPDEPTISSPSEAAAIDGTTFIFTGKANDKAAPVSTEVSSGIAKINYAFTETPTAPDADNAAWKSQTGSNGTWNINMNLGTNDADHTSAHNTADTLYEGHYWLHVKAEDGAGNPSTVITREFYVDQAAPKATTYLDSVEVNDNSKRTTTAANFKFKYKVEESYGYAAGPTLTVKKDGTAIDKDNSAGATTGYKETAGTETDAGYTVVTLNGTPADALYEFTLTAKDLAGKEMKEVRNVLLDTTAPSIKVNSPVFGADKYQTSESFTVFGESSDASGVKKVYYKYLAKDAAAPVTVKDQADFTGWKEATGTTNWNFDLTASDGVTKKLYICAVDENGIVSLISDETTYIVNCDTENPAITAKLYKTSDLTDCTATNEGFTISGTASDSNGINSVKVKQTGVAAKEYTADYNSTDGKWSLTDFPITKDSRSNGVKSGELSDGEYTFKVEVEDNAGKKSTETLKLLIDTIDPSNITPALTWTDGEASGSIHNNNSTKLKVTVKKETNLDTVYYYVNNKSNATITDYTKVPASDWNALVGEKSLSFEDGRGEIYIKAVDKAGNTGVASTVNYEVDTTKPDVCTVTYYNDAVFDGARKTVNGKNPIAIKLNASDYNNAYNDAASGKIGDDVTRIDKVEITKIGTTTLPAAKVVSGTATKSGTTKTGEWTLTIPAATIAKPNGTNDLADGNHTIKATVTDVAGNSKEFDLFDIMLDSTPPAPSFGTIVDADKVTTGIQINGTIDIDGTVVEANTLKTVKLEYLSAANTWTEVTAASKTQGAIFKYTGVDTTQFTYDSDDSTDGIQTKLRIYAEDEAGNKTTDKTVTNITKDITVDQNTDRPIIKFTNLNLDNGKYILKYGTDATLEGSLTDDDATSEAVVQEFIASSTKLTAIPTSGSGGWTRTQATGGTTVTWQNTTYGTTTIDLISGEYTYVPADPADGNKEVYFIVKDNKNGVFYTGNTTPEQKPYQQYKTSSREDNDSVLKYMSDSSAPEIESLKLQAYTGSTANGSEVTPSTETIVGGTKKNKISFIVKADDASGIASMEMTITPPEGTAQTLQTSRAADGSFTATTSESASTVATWTTKSVDVSSFGTGSVTVTVKFTDQSGLYSNANYTFMVDNAGPNINISSPSSSSQTTGEVTISGQSTDTGTAGASTIEVLIPTKANRTAAGGTVTSKTAYYKTLSTGWSSNKHGDSTVSSFDFVFNGDTANDMNKFDTYTKDDTTKIYDYTSDDYGVYVVPVIFRSEDTLGNVSIKEFNLKYNPDADKPNTVITYPSSSYYDTGKDYVTLGGEIRVTGSINIPSLTTTPEKVYIQIATDAGTFDETDKAKCGSGTGNYGLTVKTVSDVESDISKTITGFGSDSVKTAWWGIEAERTSNSWSILLNSDGKLNPASGTNNIKIRACGVNAEGKMGAWSDAVSVHIDADAPSYAGKLYAFSAAPTAANLETDYSAVKTADAERAYDPSIFLSGEKWYIGTRITDNDTVTVNTVKKGNETLTDYYVFSTADNKIAWVFIKIDSSAAVTQTYTINAQDNANGNVHYVNPSYDIKIDNLAPTMTEVKSGEGYPLSMTKQKTSNKVITFGATATDEGSGFKRLAYYFKRGTSIELPIPAAENAQQHKWKVGTAYTSTSLSVTNDNMSGVTITGSVSGKKFTGSGVSSHSFIRKGGIVKISGSYYKITDVSTNEVTVDGDIPSNATSAFFPAVLVVDNTSSESSKGWTSGVQELKGDDGDGVLESVQKSGSTWTWDTSIYAGELDDGEVTLVCVAFDDAGNCAKTETTFMLANNTPRLSKVYLATDLNGDGNFTDDELGTSVVESSGSKNVVRYYSALSSGNLQEVFTIYGNTSDTANSTTDSGVTMRDKLGVAFEFVSGYEGYGEGTGTMQYKMTVSQAEVTGPESGITAALSTASSPFKATGKDLKYMTANVSDFYNTTSKAAVTTYGTYREMKVSGETGYNSTAGYYRNYLHLTLWDNTNNKTGTGDGAVTANPYTNNSGDPATYDTYASFGAQYTVVNIPLYMDLVDGVAPTVTINDPEAVTDEGHVDLKSTITGNAPFTVTNTDTSGQFDNDDKVSGKIKFTGTINDDKRISQILLTSSKNFSSTAITSKVLANYDAASGKFKDTQTTPAAITPGTTVITPATGVDFKIMSSTFSTTTGHTVEWEMVVDTTKVAGVAAADVKFTVTAKDSANTTDTAHKVDIVPYITGITRSGTGLETKRSKLGKYQVVIGESVAVTGFNLPTTEKTNATPYAGFFRATTANMKSTTVPNTNKITSDSRTATGATLTVPGNSGYVVAVTNNIVSLNNMNTGNAQTGVNSDDEWTDDVYLNCWKNNEYFYFSNDPISPAMDGIAYSRTAGGNTYNLRRLYGGWASNSSQFLASYAAVNGTTLAPSPASGSSDTSTSSQNFGDPATFYDVIIDGSNRYNLLIDCWQGNNSGATTGYWGKNFVLNKNGIYTHNGCSSNTNVTDTNIIERMGSDKIPGQDTSSTGYDSMFNQFLNPRVAYKNNYGYVTYYDRYAKCLKFASIQFNNNNNNKANKYATEGNYTNGKYVVAGYETLQNGGTKSAMDVGLWSAIGVDSESGKNDSPVIAYYDAKNKCLNIATAKTRSQHPENSNNNVLGNGTTITAPTGGTNPGEGNAWNRQTVTGSAALKLGQYVSMVVDSSNNLHIAAYGTAGGNKLYYIYGAKSAYGTYTFTTTCVDPNGAGTWTDIQLDSDENPVISYYDPSNDSSEHAVKVAYFDGTNWDTMTAPLKSSAVSNRITLALDVTDGASLSTATANNSKLAVGYVSSRFDCIYLRKE